MRRKKLILATGVILASLALAVPAAVADPVGPPIPRALNGGGSDTTFRVMNALSEAINIGGVRPFGSYNSIGAPDPYTTKAGCTIPRERTNGSTNGVNALQDAQEGVADVTGTGGVPCFDFARSSVDNSASFPANPPGGNGRLSYIPFATDGLTIVTRGDSPLPADFSIADLQAIYNCQFPTTDVQPVLPQRGSGTRSFFLTQLGVPSSQQGTYEDTRPCINVNFPNRMGPEENRGNALTNPLELVPYSIAVFQSQLFGRVPNDIGRGVTRTISGLPSKLRNPAGPSFTIVLRNDSPLPTSFTTAELRDIYRCVTDPAGTDVRPVLPAPGALRTAFINLIDPGLTQAQIDAYQVTRPCINLDFPANGRAGPPENQGNRLVDPRSIMPHDIVSFLQQLFGTVTNNLGRIIPGLINNVPPTILNRAVTMNRLVYNVIPTRREATNPWSNIFVDTDPNPAVNTSLICLRADIIVDFGFGLADNCGAIVARTT